MTPLEVNALLTHAAKFDPRMKRNDPVEQADIAEAWAGAIPDEVTLIDARLAVEAHYRAEVRPFMLADLTALAGVAEVSTWVDRTDEVLDAIARRELAELGTTPEEYRADAGVRVRVDAVLDARQIERDAS